MHDPPTHDPTSPRILRLREVPQARAPRAALLPTEFRAEVPGASADGLAERLAQARTGERLPLCRVDMDGHTPVGVANLIEHDDPNPRIGRPWLAGLMGVPIRRGQGVGTRLGRTVLDDARRLGEHELFLGTDGPGFYRQLGARVHRQLRSAFWLMRFDPDARA